MLKRVSTLAEKALLIKLTTRRVSLTKKDAALTDALRAQENDQSLVVSSRLFADKTNPIHAIMTAVNEVYAYHKTNTLPWADAGPRLLPHARYFDYTNEIKNLRGKVTSLMQYHMPHYDSYVLQDLGSRTARQATTRASIDQYPTREQFESSTSIIVTPQQITNNRHWLFDLTDDDLAAADAAEELALKLANEDIINRMLKPLKALTDRLAEYKGEKGERFHTSIIGNVIDGCRLARGLALDPSTDLLREIDALERMAQTYFDHADVIKESPAARDDAFKRLAEAADKMEAYF